MCDGVYQLLVDNKEKKCYMIREEQESQKTCSSRQHALPTSIYSNFITGKSNPGKNTREDVWRIWWNERENETSHTRYESKYLCFGKEKGATRTFTLYYVTCFAEKQKCVNKI